MMTMKAIKYATLAMLLGCSTARARDTSYCDVFVCVPGCPTGGCGQMSPISFCCTPEGYCVQTTLLGNCDPDDFVVICEWGQSNPDGSVTCYDGQ